MAGDMDSIMRSMVSELESVLTEKRINSECTEFLACLRESLNHQELCHLLNGGYSYLKPGQRLGLVRISGPPSCCNGEQALESISITQCQPP